VVSRRAALAAGVTVAVAAASADSSIVALALPQLYGEFHTTVVGVSWVLTAYNAAVAATALAVLPFRRRVPDRQLYGAGVVVFLAASAVCAAANGLTLLIGARVVQGVGGALLLAGSVGVLEAVTASRARTVAAWAGAAGIGVAVGPALGGLLTESFDWRAIFVVQVPIAGFGLVALLARTQHVPERSAADRAHLVPDVAIGLLFGALVGALFLSVLLLIPGWSYSPIRGAAFVSALPLCGLVSRRALRPPDDGIGAVAGGALLALGLVALAFLPRGGAILPLLALAVCGTGLGLALPVLSGRALGGGDLQRNALVTVGARHVGLVAALALVAPVLSDTLPSAAHRAERQATAVLLDAPVALTKKLPVALDLGSAFHRARSGQLPDLAEPFDAHGARTDAALARTRDKLIGTVDRTVARAFRTSFLLCAAFALAAALVALAVRPTRA
jgi:MFS family permease